MSRMLALLMAGQLTPPSEHLGTELAAVGQHTRVQRTFVDLQVGLGGECLITVLALVVSSSLMNHFDVSRQFHLTGQQFPTMITGKHFLRHDFSFRVDTMLPRPDI